MTWININKQKPEERSKVWVLAADNETVLKAWYKKGKLWDCDFQGVDGEFLEPLSLVWWSPIEAPKKVRWRPENRQVYYYISHDGAFDNQWDDDPHDIELRKNFGIYRTEEDALAMRDKIVALVTQEIGECE